MASPDTGTVADRLIEALLASGVDHVFGIPGDFTLQLNKRVEERMAFVGTLDEQGAGFAADAYARLRGLGCVMVTWGVGGLKLVNSTAQAWAENSPVASSRAELEQAEICPFLGRKVTLMRASSRANRSSSGRMCGCGEASSARQSSQSG